jgi:excisionase family DNA binding protein
MGIHMLQTDKLPDPFPPQRLVRSKHDTAEALGVGLTSVDNLIASGKLKTLKIGRRRLVLEESIAELLATAA